MWDAAGYPVLAAGDVLALHSKAIHGGGTNRSAVDRDLIAVQLGLGSARRLHASADEPFTLQPRAEFFASA